jgi:ABC-type phosphate transport system substrate-binding protein
MATLMAMSFLVAPTTASSAQTGSQVTKTWLSEPRDEASYFYPEFKDFRVSVSQTENLANQGVEISWSGLGFTNPGEFASNYVQIMQCWGDATGPTPEQCQWGSPNPATSSLMGAFAANRDFMSGEDPKQPYTSKYLVPPPRNQPWLLSYRMPFTPVKGSTTFLYNQYFGSDTSNEYSAAPTGASGSGQAVFEVQTALEAPHLGCGAQTETGPRKCWIVVVPRGELRADGSTLVGRERLNGSPLSASNWENRIQIQIGFTPLTVSCQLGNAERRVVGSELIAAAFTSWQPALCADTATFGYSQIGDGEARRQITGTLGGSSGLAFVSDPPSQELVGESELLYAPVANSAIVVAYNIDKNFRTNSPLSNQNGSPITELSLNARLIAKLLTQSYQNDVPGGSNQDHVKSNPRTLVVDPEFVSLNPDFAAFQTTIEPAGLMVALGESDANSLVWKWLQNDPKAKAFLEGQPDQWGMVVNKFYRSLDLENDLEIESFPKADLSTYRPNQFTPESGFSTLDMRPYTVDMLDAALATRRGDSRSKTVWDTNRLPPAFVSAGTQTAGQRFMIAITDLPAANRYGLGIAKLVTANGSVTTASDSSINTAAAQMPVDKFTGMKYNDGKSLSGSAYPWTMLTYAAVNVCTQTSAALSNYSDMLSYATGKGQISGESQGMLPFGYVPLSKDLVTKSKQVAQSLTSKSVATNCTKTPPVEPTPTEEPSPEPTDPTDPTPVEPVDPIQPGPVIRADSFKTLSEGGSMTSTVVLASLAFGFPGMLIGAALLARTRRKKELDSSN